MTDTPKRIGLVSNGLGGWRLWSKDEPGMGGRDHPDAEYIIAAEHDRIVAEARNKALEDAAMCCEAEADKCDDAVKWNGPGRYARDCKAAAYAMRDRAAAIRAMKG